MRYCGFLVFFCAVLRFSDLPYAPPRRGRNEKRLQKSEVSFSDGLLATSRLPLLKLSKTRELNQTRLQRKREPYLKMLLGVSAIISQLFRVLWLVKLLANYPVNKLIGAVSRLEEKKINKFVTLLSPSSSWLFQLPRTSSQILGTNPRRHYLTFSFTSALLSVSLISSAITRLALSSSVAFSMAAMLARWFFIIAFACSSCKFASLIKSCTSLFWASFKANRLLMDTS